MKVEFHDSYFLLVLAGLWALCFLRPLLRCVSVCAETAAQCVDEGIECECCEECHGCGLWSQNGLLLALFAQPVLMGGVGVWARSAGAGQSGESSIYLVQFEKWQWPVAAHSAEFKAAHNATAPGMGVLTNESESVEMPYVMIYTADYLFFSLPYAFSVSVSSILLVHLIQANILSDGSGWDDGLDADVLVYEGAYAAELFCMNLSLFAASSGARPLTTLLSGAALLTMLQLYFVAASRFPRSQTVEHNIATGFLVVTCWAGALLWPDLANFDCGATVAMAGVHIALAALVVVVHFSAMGAVSARSIVRVRLFVSAVACSAHLVQLASGRDRACSPRS